MRCVVHCHARPVSSPLSFVPLASAGSAVSLSIHWIPAPDPLPLRKQTLGLSGDARADVDMP
jgi:hypothetical protein